MFPSSITILNRRLIQFSTRLSSRYLEYGKPIEVPEKDPLVGNYIFTERDGFVYFDDDGNLIPKEESPYKNKTEEILHECALTLPKGRKVLKTRKFIYQKDKKKQFVDWIKVDTIAGSGGSGCCHLRRTRSGAGGPDGGDGGRGGSIYVEADKSLTHLPHVLRYYKALNGGEGRSNDCHGANAPDIYIKVPVGTTLTNTEDRKTIDALGSHGDSLLLARGGVGGYGNTHFKSATNQAPVEATPGSKGESYTFEVELKTIADIGLIGFPNVGKSTLLRALSRAKPRVASYPFTTLKPHIGMVQYNDGEQIAVADIPGLVNGAHLNRGLGHSFLRHIERCRGLFYVIDCSDDHLCDQYDALNDELYRYKRHLVSLPSAVIANKIDLIENSREQITMLSQHTKLPVLGTSAKFSLHIENIKDTIRNMINELKRDNVD